MLFQLNLQVNIPAWQKMIILYFKKFCNERLHVFTSPGIQQERTCLSQSFHWTLLWNCFGIRRSMCCSDFVTSTCLSFISSVLTLTSLYLLVETYWTSVDTATPDYKMDAAVFPESVSVMFFYGASLPLNFIQLLLYF